MTPQDLERARKYLGSSAFGFGTSERVEESLAAEFEQVRAEALEEAAKIAQESYEYSTGKGYFGLGPQAIAKRIRELATKHIAATQPTAGGGME